MQYLTTISYLKLKTTSIEAWKFDFSTLRRRAYIFADREKLGDYSGCIVVS
jgi:hypothetical protein